MQPKAHYTHCHGHSISLSVKEVTKRSKFLGNTMGVAEEIVVLIKHYGCCRRNSGARKTLWVLQKK